MLRKNELQALTNDVARLQIEQDEAFIKNFKKLMEV